MGIAALFIFVWGIYLFIKRRRGQEVPEEARDMSSRVGRSVHAAIPLPALMGQAPASMMPGPQPDEIGPEESHIVTVKSDRGDEPASEVDIESVRARLDAALPADKPSRRRRAQKG